MLKYLTKSLSRAINVYQGISPSLLATMSLSVDIKGSTQQQLVQSLSRAQLISASDVAAWSEVDRSHFTRAPSPYQNKPYPISNGQNMTDIFSHAVIINNLCDRLKQKVRVLDVGTGHGYLAFLIAKILERRNIVDYSITGVDINEEAIQFCRNIHSKHYQIRGHLAFQCCDLQQYLRGHDLNFDIIIGGYYLEGGISSRLASRLTQDGTGIWPTQSQHGQALYKLQPNKQKIYLMETLFSMPVARSGVDNYFISEKDKHLEEQHTPIHQNQKMELDGEQKLKIRKETQQILRKQLKVLLEKYRKADGKLLTLQEMRGNEEIKHKLDQLQKLPKTKIKTPSK